MPQQHKHLLACPEELHPLRSRLIPSLLDNGESEKFKRNDYRKIDRKIEIDTHFCLKFKLLVKFAFSYCLIYPEDNQAIQFRFLKDNSMDDELINGFKLID